MKEKMYLKVTEVENGFIVTEPTFSDFPGKSWICGPSPSDLASLMKELAGKIIAKRKEEVNK